MITWDQANEANNSILNIYTIYYFKRLFGTAGLADRNVRNLAIAVTLFWIFAIAGTHRLGISRPP